VRGRKVPWQDMAYAAAVHINNRNYLKDSSVIWRRLERSIERTSGGGGVFNGTIRATAKMALRHENTGVGSNSICGTQKVSWACVWTKN
jgi:hypothetical protein